MSQKANKRLFRNRSQVRQVAGSELGMAIGSDATLKLEFAKWTG